MEARSVPTPFARLPPDLDALRARFEGDADLLLAVVQLSLRKRSQYLPVAAAQGESTGTLLRQLHDSAGLFGIFGCQPTMLACRAWEARIAGVEPVDAQGVARWLQSELMLLYADITALEAQLLAH